MIYSYKPARRMDLDGSFPNVAWWMSNCYCETRPRRKTHDNARRCTSLRSGTYSCLAPKPTLSLILPQRHSHVDDDTMTQHYHNPIPNLNHKSAKCRTRNHHPTIVALIKPNRRRSAATIAGLGFLDTTLCLYLQLSHQNMFLFVCW